MNQPVAPFEALSLLNFPVENIGTSELSPLEQLRVVAHLPQLHDQIKQPSILHGLEYPLEAETLLQGSVKLLLVARHSAQQLVLEFLPHFLLNIFLYSSKHERL